jgi:hypothetical protein
VAQNFDPHVVGVPSTHIVFYRQWYAGQQGVFAAPDSVSERAERARSASRMRAPRHPLVDRVSRLARREA